MFMTAPAHGSRLDPGSRMHSWPKNDSERVILARRSRDLLARLQGDQRAALEEAFVRVGRDLLAAAEAVAVDAAWARRTWPRRRYPQQCYARTTSYVLDHAEIK